MKKSFDGIAQKGTQKPINVVVNIGSDDPNRGDSKGFVGVGQGVAAATGGGYTYLTDEILAQRYPKTHPSSRLKAYFDEHGYPDMYFGKENEVLYSEFTQHKVYWENRWNETISRAIGEYEMVSHDITPELLASEAQKFRQHYSHLPEPVIAVNMVNITNPDVFTTRMAQIARNYPEATIFFCASRRTSGSHYDSVMAQMREKLTEIDLQDCIKVDGFNLNRQRKGYNPYVGLLGAAENIIVEGDSHSLISEAVATGKVIYRSASSKGSSYYKLREKGYIKSFDDQPLDQPLATISIKPINITEKIVAYMIRSFNAFRGDNGGVSSSYGLDKDQKHFHSLLKLAA